jgi:hypothetical protein
VLEEKIEVEYNFSLHVVIHDAYGVTLLCSVQEHLYMIVESVQYLVLEVVQ